MYAYSKNMILGIAALLLNKGMLHGSKVESLLSSFRIRVDKDDSVTAARIENAVNVNLLQLSKAESAMKDFVRKYKSKSKESVSEGLAYISDALGYHIPLEGLTLAQYCSYFTLARKKYEKARK